MIFLQLLIYLLVGVITCAVDVWLTEDYSKTTILKKWLIDTLLTNAALAWYQSGELYAGEV